MSRLMGRVALITGGSSGIGLATAPVVPSPWGPGRHHWVPANDRHRELIRVARAAWPGIDLPEDTFVALVDASASGPEARPLEELPAAELWLALACVRGDPQALGELETRVFQRAEVALRHMGMATDMIADVLQIVRMWLLVAEAGQAPRILAAAVQGNLPGLVRVVAVRQALNIRRKDRRLDVGDQRLLDQLAPDDDPELAALKAEHSAVFKAAIEDAVAGLKAQDRNVLRMHLIHGLPIDAIGQVFQVHRATAARWLTAIRAQIDRESRRLLRERQGITDADFDSLMRLAECNIQVSFHRVLTASSGE